jgi:hypothetical protein
VSQQVIRVAHGPDPEAPGQLVTTEWDDYIESEPGTLADAAALAAEHGLDGPVATPDNVTTWRRA